LGNENFYFILIFILLILKLLNIPIGSNLFVRFHNFSTNLTRSSWEGISMSVRWRITKS